MRIAFVCQPIGTFGLPPRGSLEIWTVENASRLAQDHEVTIYARGDGRDPAEETYRGVRIRRLRAVRDTHPWLPRLTERLKRARARLGVLRSYFASPLHYLSYGARVARELRRTGCQVAHVMNFPQIPTVIRALAPEVKVVLHMQCEWLTQLPERSTARQLAATARVLGCSRYIADTARVRFPQHAHRFAWVHNGVDVDRFTPDTQSSTRPRRFLYVGRLSPEKGVHLLVRAFEAVATKYPDAVLDLVGPPWSAPPSYILEVSEDPKVKSLAPWFSADRPDGYAQRLRELVAPELGARVRFRGGLDHYDLVDEYRRSLALVFPSVWPEPFGMPIIEAMACGIPVITTRGGGIPELVQHERTGLLVERGDVAALAAALDRLLGEPDLAERLGEAGRREAVERFSWDTVAHQLAEHLATVIAPANADPPIAPRRQTEEPALMPARPA